MSDTQSYPQHLDMAGKPILRGSLIVYATSQQASGRMKCGIVRELQWRNTERWVGGASRTNGGDGHYEPVQQPKLSVITAENGIDWLARHDGATTSLEHAWHVQKRGRAIMLDRLDELLVVDESALPVQVITMLREALAKHGV